MVYEVLSEHAPAAGVLVGGAGGRRYHLLGGFPPSLRTPHATANIDDVDKKKCMTKKNTSKYLFKRSSIPPASSKFVQKNEIQTTCM